MTNKPCPVDRGKLLIGLECCRAIKCLGGCPYSEVGCDEIAVDALVYINYLEEQLHAKADSTD